MHLSINDVISIFLFLSLEYSYNHFSIKDDMQRFFTNLIKSSF